MEHICARHHAVEHHVLRTPYLTSPHPVCMCIFKNNVLQCSPSWLQTHGLLALAPKHWDYMHVSLHLHNIKFLNNC